MDRELHLEMADFGSIAIEIIETGTSIRFRAHGFSMRPFISDGDRLEVQSCRSEDLKTGDIILFQTKHEGILVHRILKIEYETDGILIQTQGDANPQPDSWIQQDNIIGQVIRIERKNIILKINNASFRLAGKFWRMIYPIARFIYRLFIPLHQNSSVG